MTTVIKIDPNEVYQSIKIRQNHLGSDFYDFATNLGIEFISEIEPCVMESKGNRFVVCYDPGGGYSLKIPEQVAMNLVGNPYFDNEVLVADFPKIDAILDNLSEEDKKIVEKAKEFGDGSGNRNMEVKITVSINCDWNGDPWNPEVSVADIDSRDTLKYGVDWDEVKEIENHAKQEVLDTISKYKNIVQRIANDLKISSDELNKYIMGWL